MKKWWIPAIFIFLPLVLGFLISIPLGIPEKYALLQKPPLSPPPILFPIVWTILYLLMGIGSYIVYKSNYNTPASKPLTPYIIQLIFNFLWTPVFFGLGNYLSGAIISLLIITFLVWTIIEFFKVNKFSAYIQIPYLLWSVFASYLSFGVFFLNM